MESWRLGSILRPRQQFRLEPALHETRDDQQQHQHEGRRQHRPERQVNFPDLESERNVPDRVEQIGGGYFPRAYDQEERRQDQHHAHECRQQCSAEPEAASADTEAVGQRAPFGGVLADRGKKRLGNDQQQVKRPEDRRGDDHPQCHEGGQACITHHERKRDQRRHQQTQRIGPCRGHQDLAAAVFDSSQPDDEVQQDRSRDRRKQRIGGNGDDEGHEQGLVDDLQGDQDTERSRTPDQMIVEAARGFVVFLHQPALRIFRRKEPARDAVAEGSRGNAGDKSLGNLLDPKWQQPERIPKQQDRAARQRCARSEPNEHPQRHPSFRRARVGWPREQPQKPPSGHSDRDGGDQQRDQRDRRNGCSVPSIRHPSFKQRARPLQLDRQRIESIQPEEWIEHARTAREQLAGIQGMALLGHPLAQLVDPDREHTRLFQRAVELAEVGRELLAFIGDFRGFGRRILRRRGAELLEPLLDLARARLELVDLAPKSVQGRV